MDNRRAIVSSRWPTALAALALAAVSMSLAAHAEAAKVDKVGKVDRYKHGKSQLRIKKESGREVTKKVARNVRVKLTDRRGNSAAEDVNELVPGAKVLNVRKKKGRIKMVELLEKPSGSSDCSFDMSAEDEDLDESFDCISRYEGDVEDCSFDQSGDSEPGDSSKDSSWDCSYSSEDLDWDCSYDSSQSASFDPDGGDADADFSFDCSWDSEQKLDGPLWDCELIKNELAFACGSSALRQEFGAALDLSGSGIAVDSFADFFRDYVPEEEDGEDVNCTGGDGSADCSFSGDAEIGDCSVDFSFDTSREPGFRDGDVSGDMSVSCSYETV